MKINEYPTSPFIADNDVILIEGDNGTRTITANKCLSTASALKQGIGNGAVSFSDSDAISENTIAFGKNSIAGSKCFRILSFDDTNKAYTLDSVDGLEVGDVFNPVL